MKRLLKYIAVLSLGMLVLSCGEDKLDGSSIFVDSPGRTTPFDTYLYREFTVPFNIEFKYWLDDRETDQEHVIAPAGIGGSKIMAVLMKHLWLDVYSEASPDGVKFVKQYSVRTIQLVGSGQFDSGGKVLGQAESGKKIVMFDVNELNTNNLTDAVLRGEDSYFHTIHHEFAHILHQTKNYPTNFRPISNADYTGDLAWQNLDPQSALNLGFITPYGSKNENEDFVEIFSVYITMTEAEWNNRIGNANTAGKAKLEEKLDIIKNYISASWNMNMDELRAIILRRAQEVIDKKLEFVDLK